MRLGVQQARDLRDHVFGLVTPPAKHRDGIADVADDGFEPVNRDSFGFFDVRHVLTSLAMEAFLKFAATTTRVGARYRAITEGPDLAIGSFSDGSENPRRSARSTKTDRRVSLKEETADCPTLRTRVCEAEPEKMTTREPADWGRHHPPAIRAPSKPQFRFDRPGCSDGNVDAAMEVGRFERRHARPGTCSAVPLGLRRSNCERGTILSGPRQHDGHWDGLDFVCAWVDRDDRAA